EEVIAAEELVDESLSIEILDTEDVASKILDTEDVSSEDLTAEAHVTENVTSEELVSESLASEDSQVEAMETDAFEVFTTESLISEAATIEAEIAENTTAETPVMENTVLKANNSEVASTTAVSMPVLEEALSADSSNDIFDILDLNAENAELDENETIKARLAMAGTAALVSATAAAVIVNSDNSQNTTENSEQFEASNLDFSDILLDNEANSTPNTESESEVDALLESLILGEGNKTRKSTVSDDVITETDLDGNSELDDDTFTKSLTPDEKLDNDLDSIFDSEFNNDTSIKDEVKNEIEEVIEVVEQETTDSTDIDLQNEEITIVEKTNTLPEENEDLSLDEDFTMHDDLNPSDEDVYANTLEIDYADIKAKDSETLPSINIEVESEETLLEIDEDLLEEEINELAGTEELNETKESLDTELFSLELETIIETDDAISASIDSTLEILEDNLSSDKANFNTTLDEEADDELNSLLKEVSTKSENLTATPDNISKISAFIEETIAIEDDLDDVLENKEKLAPSDKDKADFDLQSLLNEVREEAGADPSVQSGVMSGSEQTNVEKRWIQLCGNIDSITTQKEVAKISFTLKDHLLDVLLKQIEATKDSEQLYRIKYNDLIIVLDHSQDCIYCNLPVTSDEYSETCFAEIEHKQIKVHDLDYSEVKLYRDKIEQNPDRAHSIESFIWSTSLLTSRGRLPAKTDITKKIGLKMWPNLTRVELTPNAMQIAAVFSKNPGNLLEVSEWLGLEQRYVFAFYNAALSLGMIELDSSKLKKPSFSLGKKNSKDKSEERSFFGRLLQRLKS
ncbi:MAG: hypothetical protein V7749_14695, partial [Cocleimonas sp.]